MLGIKTSHNQVQSGPVSWVVLTRVSAVLGCNVSAVNINMSVYLWVDSTRAVIDHLKSVFAQHGSDCWWRMSTEELLPSYIKEKV